ncbi:MAG: hypothetical protein Q8O72_03215 [Bacteroidales bacterium]|nr:hypothetical protein [Bacteroidales bacterium]
MNKEFEYELDYYSKLSDLLQNSYTPSAKDSFDSDHAAYHLELVFPYYLKSGMPITFRFEMKLELLKDNYKTKLIVMLTFGFRSSVKKEINLIEQKLIRQIKKVSLF